MKEFDSLLSFASLKRLPVDDIVFDDKGRTNDQDQMLLRSRDFKSDFGNFFIEPAAMDF
jgi:hypothetical protein